MMATVALAVGGGHATASARPIVFGTEASNKRLAEVQAERELRSIKLPPGARRASGSPAPILDEALSTSGEPNLVQRSEWLVAPGSVRGMVRWFRAHAPADSYLERWGDLGSSKEPGGSLWFDVSERSRRVYGPSVILAITGLSGRMVGIRLEVQQVWKTPHPAAAKVPAAARLLYVSRQSGGGQARWQVIRAPRRVRRIARVIDQLPAAQPQVLYCPEEFGAHVEVTMKFKAREGGPVLAEASQQIPEGCETSMSLTVEGDSRTFGLDYGERVIELLHR
ncbi:MAG: hypothetical protein JWO14_4108 [Solirubrobacterales bacterium]|nr:hypothetical protein [Solirubrobacterales bacterium]